MKGYAALVALAAKNANCDLLRYRQVFWQEYLFPSQRKKKFRQTDIVSDIEFVQQVQGIIDDVDHTKTKRAIVNQHHVPIIKRVVDDVIK